MTVFQSRSSANNSDSKSPLAKIEAVTKKALALSPYAVTAIAVSITVFTVYDLRHAVEENYQQIQQLQIENQELKAAEIKRQRLSR